MGGRGRPLLPEILGQTDPTTFENADFHSISARSASAVTQKKFKKFNYHQYKIVH